MKTKEQLQDYARQFMNNPSLKLEVEDVMLALIVYRCGLRREGFPVEMFFIKDIPLSEIPEQFHTLIVRLCLFNDERTQELLEDYKNFFMVDGD